MSEWFRRLLKRTAQPSIDRDEEIRAFLTLVKNVALDDPMPLEIVRQTTLLHILQNDLAFWDTAGNRWWLTPKGDRLLPHERTDTD